MCIFQNHRRQTYRIHERKFTLIEPGASCAMVNTALAGSLGVLMLWTTKQGASKELTTPRAFKSKAPAYTTAGSKSIVTATALLARFGFHTSLYRPETRMKPHLDNYDVVIFVTAAGSTTTRSGCCYCLLCATQRASCNSDQKAGSQLYERRAVCNTGYYQSCIRLGT